MQKLKTEKRKKKSSKKAIMTSPQGVTALSVSIATEYTVGFKKKVHHKVGGKSDLSHPHGVCFVCSDLL